MTTVQDLGRVGHRSAGVPAGGAMDRFALMAANRLVGNPASAAALEATVRGPVLEAVTECSVAVTGGAFEPRVNGVPEPVWASFRLRPGDILDLSHRSGGARAYLSVGGGFGGETWLGSRSTYLLVGRGGFAGRALRTGDLLRIAGPAAAFAERSLAPSLRPTYGSSPTLSVLPGPHLSRVPPSGRRQLIGGIYMVGAASDRMGFRLEGEPVEVRGAGLLSFGVAPGCIQVPGSGLPILLMADHQTAGGYPVVAGVIRADLPVAAQLLPGDEIRLRAVDPASALEAWRRLRSGLDGIQ